MRHTDPNLIYPGSADAPQAMPGEEMDMPKRPNKRVPPERNPVLEEWGKEQVREDIRDALKEKVAADRLGALDQWGKAQETHVYSNFALTALVLAGLIILIGLAYVTGMIKP